MFNILFVFLIFFFANRNLHRIVRFSVEPKYARGIGQDLINHLKYGQPVMLINGVLVTTVMFGHDTYTWVILAYTVNILYYICCRKVVNKWAQVNIAAT